MHKRTKNLSPKPISVLLIGALSEMVLVVLFSFILSLVFYRLDDPVGYSSLAGLISITLSGVCLGAFISRILGEGGVTLAALSSLLFTLVLIIVGIISGGRVKGGVIVSYAVTVGASALTAYLTRPKARRRTRR